MTKLQGNLSCGRDGSGTEGVGIIRFVDGHPYIDEVPFLKLLEQFQDKYCECAFFFPAKVPKVYQTCDEHILPLVQALNEKGVRTLSSCEGHMEERFGYSIARPFVCVHLDDWRKSGLQVPEGWEMSRTPVETDLNIESDATVASLQMKTSAANEEELKEVHRKTVELAEAIRAIR